MQFRQKTALLSCCLKTSFDLLTSILLYHIEEEEEEIFFITITTISIIGKSDSGDPPSRCLVKGRERVADPVAESTLTGTAQ